MRAIGYVRVSTERQAEDGLGLKVQEQAVRRLCKENGLRLVRLYSDEGISGTKELDARPGVLDALAALRDGSAGVLVVYRLDRLARDLILQEQLLAEVRRSGAQVFSCSPAEAAYLTDDPDDPSRKLIRQVLGAVSEYERSMIALRLRSGRRRKAEQGGFAYGAPPFGFTAENRELVRNSDEARAVALIRKLRAQGESYRGICRALTDAGHKPKRGGQWHPQVVARITSRSTR
ncbi:MAG TPA: recombinase family protein [Actinomycetota bacterium]|nr:recombinase family protein [Actinomycetota bacterium]